LCLPSFFVLAALYFVPSKLHGATGKHKISMAVLKPNTAVGFLIFDNAVHT